MLNNYLKRTVLSSGKAPVRCFAKFERKNITVDAIDHVKSLGINHDNIIFNPSVAEIYEHAMRPRNKESHDPLVRDTAISETGALVSFSGERTGRSPKDKRIVYDSETKDTVWWGDVNIPLSPDSYEYNRNRTVDYLNTRHTLFVIDGYGGWDPNYRIKCRVVCNRPYHALFMKQMMIRPSIDDLRTDFKEIDFTILNGGEFPSDPKVDGVTGRTSVAVNFTEKEICILGSQYAGEMKKGLFGIMHYLMPKKGVLSMHASANEGKDGDTTILFGLSGTGKTTLSADPHRALIGDDEHCWTDDGIFNIEGGCYAKTINLSREKEPEIFDAIQFGSVLENIGFFKDQSRAVNYDDASITENTRVCYPLEFIPGSKIPAVGGHPKNIIYLTCDASGVLPPVSKLTREQSMYYFINGYTAKVAGTEMGVTEPQATFSACFGEAFIPLHPSTYAEMLAEKSDKFNTKVWLINTGWTGGKYGTGKRMSLKDTRAIIDAIHDGVLENTQTKKLDIFGLHIPTACPGVDNKILDPQDTWPNKDAYTTEAKKLANLFIKNFAKYEAGCDPEIKTKGGPTL